MAPKRPNPLEDPPAASSSEEEVSSEEEEEEMGQGKKEDSSSGEEDDEEEEEEDDQPTTGQPASAKPPPKKPQSTAALAGGVLQKPQPADSGSDSDTETGSDSESEPETPLGSSVKPIASKPMVETPVAKSARPSVVALPAKVAKRPAESEPDSRASKRAKKSPEAKPNNGVAEEDGKRPGEDTRKQLFQRVFSEDDEIALLEGILDYTEKKGHPYGDMDSFYGFLKKSIDFEGSKSQLVDKIRRLRVKYKNHIKKDKKGEGKTFSKPHDQKVFDLSKKIWGSGGVLPESESKTNAKSKKNQKGNSKALVELKQDLFTPPNDEEGEKKETSKKDMNQNVGLQQCGNTKITSEDVVTFMRMMPGVGVDELTVRQAWDGLEGPKKKALEEKLKVIRSAEVDLLILRTDFLHEAVGEMFKTSKAHFPGSDH